MVTSPAANQTYDASILCSEALRNLDPACLLQSLLASRICLSKIP